MSTRRSRGGAPRRTASSAAIKKELLVFTEGEKTEPNYLTGWYQDYRRYITVQFGDVTGVDPLTLVTAAVAAKDVEAKAERKGKGRAHDEVWCIFDTDEHPQLPAAKDLAGSRR